MNVNAGISKDWRRRMLFLFFMLFGIAAWFLSDGYLMWPGEAERYEDYSKIKEELIESGKAEDEESSAIRIAWQKHAREMDYPEKTPKERTDSAIREQRVIGWVMMTGVGIFGAWIAWNHTRKLRAEGDVIIGVSGERVEIDSIVGLDRKKWDDKGIMYAIYEDEGKRRKLTLDAHKFKGGDDIVEEVQNRLRSKKEATES